MAATTRHRYDCASWKSGTPSLAGRASGGAGAQVSVVSRVLNRRVFRRHLVSQPPPEKNPGRTSILTHDGHKFLHMWRALGTESALIVVMAIFGSHTQIVPDEARRRVPLPARLSTRRGVEWLFARNRVARGLSGDEF